MKSLGNLYKWNKKVAEKIELEKSLYSVEKLHCCSVDNCTRDGGCWIKTCSKNCCGTH